ncbi:uncharacterized metal-binding protein [Longilinea arvoryzae]|uniref:Uncharacterized metal-binding protein n=2 Tax=Longilinea arvoryzae TaxID=360412 RepID=A0A0S7BF44_9CHLR|nr:uncharacterized metal-binding protein [Longilinea arvoryzae]
MHLEAAARLVRLANGSPVLGELIGPFSLAGRIFGVSESLELSAAEPELLEELLKKTTGFELEYARAFKQQGVHGVILAEPAAGLPVESLGTAPYLPAVTEPLEIPARQIGLSIAPNANGYFPPNIAGFVGADHVAMLLAAREVTSSSTVLAIDIGTNTEVSLFHAGQHYCCSCASGPAFEGAHIHQGMRAAPGAIERVRLESDRVWVQTVGNAPAVGICGSGVLDAVAELRRQERIDSRGVFTSSSEKARRAFILVPAGQSGNRADIVLTRKDINEIQLAKGAIRSGIDILLETAGIPADRVDQIIIAGAFGTYLNLESALRIGMFPALPLQRFTQVGNAAGAGACLLLASASARQSAREIASKAHYVELTTYAGYVDHFSRALSL